MPATLEAGKLRFSQHFASRGVSRDGFADVSLLTGGTEALGHDIFVDEVTVEQAVKSLLGRSVPAYLTHGSFFEGDRLTKEVGFYSGVYRDGLKVKAKQFNFFSAFTKHFAHARDMLVELAEKMPGEFGISIVFDGYAAWVMPDGTELPADYPKPEGAFDMPRARIRHVDSADFVKHPAANADGLFQAKPPAEVTVPEPQPKQASVTTSNGVHTETHTVTIAPVDAAGTGMADANPAQIQLSAEEFARFDALTAELSELRITLQSTTDENVKLQARNSELAAGIVKVTEQLSAKDAEIATLSAKLAAAEKLSAANIGVPPVAVITEAQATAPAEKALTRGEHLKAHAEIKDPAAARAYWEKHLTLPINRIL